jgi:predicted ester cyclase
MTAEDLSSVYRRYLDCLNERRLDDLHEFVSADVVYNNEPVGLTGYQRMLANDFGDIPDVHFDIGLLVVDDARVACRLEFRCTPRESWLGAGNGRTTIRFAEHVFYEFVGGKIVHVWSLIDRAAAEAQLRPG